MVRCGRETNFMLVLCGLLARWYTNTLYVMVLSGITETKGKVFASMMAQKLYVGQCEQA